MTTRDLFEPRSFPRLGRVAHVSRWRSAPRCRRARSPLGTLAFREDFGIADGEPVRVTSRRGSVVAPARIDAKLRPGLVFMTFHFPDEVDTNALTIDASDPKFGTAEFEAAAVRVERLAPAELAARS